MQLTFQGFQIKQVVRAHIVFKKLKCKKKLKITSITNNTKTWSKITNKIIAN